ncbi:MAG TPA: hypothetical protein VHZ97_10700 [Pseudonocardiaceae bacterium]|jgi:hypothetical protein|nr:hypothetical protein [Pseudonocardiaceae bacterium]
MSEETSPAEELRQDALPEEEPLDEQDPDFHPAGRLRYLGTSVGLRVAALAGFAIVAGLGMGTDGMLGSSCC